MKTAIGYIRVSTAGQAEEGVSMDAQRAKIEAWAFANDYELGDVFTDAGVSGKRADNRDGLQEALAAACKGKAALVTYSLSRVSRSTRDMLAIAERLDRAGADLVSLSEKVDTTSAAGRMVFRMLAVLNEFERDQVAERTRLAMAHMRKNGKRISGRIPFGYDLAPDGVSLVENRKEQEAIALMRRLRTEGLTLQAICNELEARGIKTKTDTTWAPATVSGILKKAA